MREFRRHFVIALSLQLIETFRSTCGNLSSIFHSDKISTDRKY